MQEYAAESRKRKIHRKIGLHEIVLRVAKFFGWTLSDMFGDFFWVCPDVPTHPCTRGASPWCKFCIGEIAVPKITGITMPMLFTLSKTALRIKKDDLSVYVYLAGSFIGAKIPEDLFDDDNDDSEKTRDSRDIEIAKRIEDPLYDFPYDVRFYNEEEVRLLMEKSKVIYNKYVAGKLSLTEDQKLALWDDQRAKAALGADIVAKRASMVDPLWVKYRRWIEEHEKCSLDRLRWFIEVDIARSKLYPLSSVPEQERLLKERWKYEAENNLEKTKVDPNLPPPQWYLDHLKKEGKLVQYMQQIEEVLARPVKDD